MHGSTTNCTFAGIALRMADAFTEKHTVQPRGPLWLTAFHRIQGNLTSSAGKQACYA